MNKLKLMNLIFSRKKIKPMKKRLPFQLPWYLRWLYLSSQSDGNNSSWMSPLFICSCAAMLLAVSGFSNDRILVMVETSSDVTSEIEATIFDNYTLQELSLTKFNKDLIATHILQRNLQINPNQFILFDEVDQATQRIGLVEKEKLLKLTSSHFKDCLLKTSSYSPYYLVYGNLARFRMSMLEDGLLAFIVNNNLFNLFNPAKSHEK